MIVVQRTNARRVLGLRPSCVLALVLTAACSALPRVQAPAPPASEGERFCSESVFVAEVDPASTLDFRPTECRLDLAGWYAARVGLSGAPQVAIGLFCRERAGSEESISLLYRGAPVDGVPLTDLLDPFHTEGRENASTLSYAFDGPNGIAHLRFLGGEVRFHRAPRPWLEAEAEGGGGAYVELGLDLRFEGDRRFRAALRICPSYAPWGPAGTFAVGGEGRPRGNDRTAIVAPFALRYRTVPRSR